MGLSKQFKAAPFSTSQFCSIASVGLLLGGVLLMSCSSGDASEPSLYASQAGEDVIDTDPESMQHAAVALLEALDADQRELIAFELSDTTARTNWSNLPDVLYDRGGSPHRRHVRNSTSAFPRSAESLQ